MAFCEPTQQSNSPAPGTVWYRTANGMQADTPQRGVCGESAGQAPSNLTFGQPPASSIPTNRHPGEVPVNQNGQSVPGALLRGVNDPTTIYSSVQPDPRARPAPIGPAQAAQPEAPPLKGWYGAGWDGPGGPPLGVYSSNGFTPAQGETRQPKFCK
jgi:hypothetical protein